MLLKKGRMEIADEARNSRAVRDLQTKLYQEPSVKCECSWKKMIGKPYSGKPNVRFDEGELEIGLSYYASSLLYCTRPHRTNSFLSKIQEFIPEGES